MAKDIGYNGLSTNHSGYSGSDSDDFFEVGKTVQESISKITLLADAKTNEMLQRLDKDYKAFTKGIQSALNDTSYFREGVKAVDPKSGRSYMEYYVQTSELENAMSAVRYLRSKLEAQNVKYDIRSQQMDYITGTRTFEGKQAQAKAMYEISRKGGKLLPSPTADNPDQYTYMLPFSTAWAKGVGETDYLDYIFEDSDALSRLEHDRRASEAEVDRNYAKAKKAEMMSKLSLTQQKEAGGVWEQFEKEQAQEAQNKLKDNYALAKQMGLMDTMSASQAKEAEGIWADFEKEQAKESALALRNNYAKAKQMKLMDTMSASQAKEAGAVWADFEAEENRNRQHDIDVNYQANKRIKRENAQKEAEEQREQEKKQREIERQQAKDSITSKTKRMFLLGQIASMFTVLLDLTRRILANGLAMASDAKRTEREARNIGSSYGAMLQYNYADMAYGLPEGTTPNALFAIQKMFGDPANIDEKALGKLAMIMGNSVGDAVQSGLGGKNPEKLIEMIMDAFLKAQQSGVNQFGQQVGKEEARRNLYTLLSEISPEIALLFSRAVEANDYGINRGRVSTWQDYLNINRRAQGSMTDADNKAFTALGEVVDQLKAKFNNLKDMITKEFLMNLSKAIDWVNNGNWGKNSTEQLQSRQETIDRIVARRDELQASNETLAGQLESTLSTYGAQGSLDQILFDVTENPSVYGMQAYTAEQRAQKTANKLALARLFQENPLARSLITSYIVRRNKIEAMEREWQEEKDPKYKELEWSEESINAEARDYATTAVEPMWGDVYLEGVDPTRGWSHVLVTEGYGSFGESFRSNEEAYNTIYGQASPEERSRFDVAYDTYFRSLDKKDAKGKIVETKELKLYREALRKEIMSGMTKEEQKKFKKSEDYKTPEKLANDLQKRLAYIRLLTDSAEGRNNSYAFEYFSEVSPTALKNSSGVESTLFDLDRKTVGNLYDQFIRSQGANALDLLGYQGWTITPQGGGIFTIKFVADVNGEKKEAEYKNIPLSGGYKETIEYTSNGTTDRLNESNNNGGV